MSKSKALISLDASGKIVSFCEVLVVLDVRNLTRTFSVTGLVPF